MGQSNSDSRGAITVLKQQLYDIKNHLDEQLMQRANNLHRCHPQFDAAEREAGARQRFYGIVYEIQNNPGFIPAGDDFKDNMRFCKHFFSNVDDFEFFVKNALIYRDEKNQYHCDLADGTIQNESEKNTVESYFSAPAVSVNYSPSNSSGFFSFHQPVRKVNEESASWVTQLCALLTSLPLIRHLLAFLSACAAVTLSEGNNVQGSPRQRI